MLTFGADRLPAYEAEGAPSWPALRKIAAARKAAFTRWVRPKVYTAPAPLAARLVEMSTAQRDALHLRWAKGARR
jgi:hypothetical protein